MDIRSFKGAAALFVLLCLCRFGFADGGAPDIEMVPVKGGKFMMGCTPEQGSDCDENEKPARRIKVGHFRIGKYEVTQKQWMRVMGEDNNPSRFKGGDLPVENVSWNDVMEFISRLNAASGKRYRLPTEAEWEYAARGGAKGKTYKYAGGNNIDEVAWYYENSGDKRLDEKNWDNNTLKNNNNRTHPVGRKAPNALGVHDMSGNVWEWVGDWYGNYNGGSRTNPTGPPTGSHRVIRGGSWMIDAKHCRVSYRIDLVPEDQLGIVGFRLVLPGLK